MMKLKCNHSDCKNYNKEVEPLLEKSGQHLKASCSACGAYIKFISQGGEPTLYYGKHKNKTIREVAIIDMQYLRWLLVESKDIKLKIKINQVLENL